MVSSLTVKMKILILLSPIFLWLPLAAQNQGNTVSSSVPNEYLIESDSILTKQYNYIQDMYYTVMNESNEILNGREYEFYFYPHISSPLIPQWQLPIASVVIHGKKYDNIMLQYDTYKDQVVYFDPNNLINNSICPIAINQYIIDEFNLKLQAENLMFKYLEFPDDLKGKLRNGFYEIVYDGGCQFIIKHKSEMVIEEGRNIYHYRPERHVVNEGIYYKIKGKRSLLKAFGDKTVEMKKYIKSSKILVKRAEKDQISSLLKFYDSLLLP